MFVGNEIWIWMKHLEIHEELEELTRDQRETGQNGGFSTLKGT